MAGSLEQQFQLIRRGKNCLLYTSSGPDVPPRSRFGNKSASLLFQVLAGLRISDTQTGLRAIPTRWLPDLVDLYGERFEYETNMLLEIPRLGIPLRERPIRTIYPVSYTHLDVYKRQA